MNIKLLADACLNEAIVSGVMRAEPSIDFMSANLMGLAGVDDDAVLEIAASEGRILVSHDLKTMPTHFGRFLKHTQSPGVILISQKTSVADAIQSILLAWLASEPSEWTNRICRLPF